MKVRILRVIDGVKVDAEIKSGKKFRLPSITDGWRFKFKTHAVEKGANVYVLVAEETPDVIEGCLIYKMLNETEPYVAFIELAPHNKKKEMGDARKYDLITGCLIAFACKLSFDVEDEIYRGWLTFDVQEEHKEDEKKLMTHYSKNYYAHQISDTTAMCISPADGAKLIEEYLGIPK